MRKKIVGFMMVLAMTSMCLASCGSSNTSKETKATSDTTKKTDDAKSKSGGKGKVYYLSFKPESDATWKKIAEEYTKETGVEMKVVTAANNTYEQTLKSEIAKSDAPTLFQINGPIGYQNWKDYCLDLKGTKLNSWLLNPDMAIKDGDGVFGIPYVEEGYGIIYNEAIMKKYFALSDKAVSINSTAEITSFDTLKKVAEDMTAKKDKLGIEGVFSSTSLLAGEDWRWQTHLANLPIYYEYKDNKVTDEEKLEFKYADNYKNILDLYLNNSCTDPKMVGSKSVDDAMAEFALGKTAMVQNGNWAWAQIAKVQGNTVKEDDVKFLPIYTGIQGEEKQGLCIGTENYFSINSKASKEDQDASIAFIEWLYSSDYGKKAVTNDLGFIPPFNTFSDSEKPQDPLAKEVIKYMSDKTKTNVDWNFTSFPSQTFKDNFGASLLQYAQGQKKWDDVKAEMIADWANEKAATKK